MCVKGFGFRVSGFGFRVSGLTIRVSVQGLWIWGYVFLGFGSENPVPGRHDGSDSCARQRSSSTTASVSIISTVPLTADLVSRSFTAHTSCCERMRPQKRALASHTSRCSIAGPLALSRHQA
eukprot:1768919-Rhodomonas_salina.1